jgi:hypothetical protein
VNCVQKPHIQPQSSKPVTQGIRRAQRVGGRRILNYPTPDYSKIAPKVDSGRRKQNIDEVSGTVACNEVHIQARNQPVVGRKSLYISLTLDLCLFHCSFLEIVKS